MLRLAANGTTRRARSDAIAPIGGTTERPMVDAELLGGQLARRPCSQATVGDAYRRAMGVPRTTATAPA